MCPPTYPNLMLLVGILLLLAYLVAVGAAVTLLPEVVRVNRLLLGERPWLSVYTLFLAGALAMLPILPNTILLLKILEELRRRNKEINI